MEIKFPHDYDPTKPWGELLSKLDACNDGLEYSSSFPGRLTDGAVAWDEAPNPEFLLWILDRLCRADSSAAREFMCWCFRHTPSGEGRTIWTLLEDERCRAVVEVAERHVRGEATDGELAEARQSAQAAFSEIEETREEKSLRFAAKAATRVGALAKVWEAAALFVYETAKAAAHAAVQEVPEDLAEGAYENAYAAALKCQTDSLRAKYGNPVRKLPMFPKG